MRLAVWCDESRFYTEWALADGYTGEKLATINDRVENQQRTAHAIKDAVNTAEDMKVMLIRLTAALKAHAAEGTMPGHFCLLDIEQAENALRKAGYEFKR